MADAVDVLASRQPRDAQALLTAEELGQLLGISPRTLKDQASAGAFPHRRFGKHYRFSREDASEITRLAGRGVRLRWRARYKRPDGTVGSLSGFDSKKAAKEWAGDQEALIRRNLWIDPLAGATLFGDFAEAHLDAIRGRLEPNTVAKMPSFLDNHLLPQWES
ncbi:helix-turn-helix domain-containing protein [Amycolatopsis sp. cg5]|uniref:helix-turn-helix domain-containing protein n=1 Tax=Amycolatopsis sp. cg5 TaxID=3238802 RepID=UPI0035244EC6